MNVSLRISRRFLVRLTCLALASLVFFNQVLFAHRLEQTFWSDRGKKSQPNSSSTAPVQLAALPADFLSKGLLPSGATLPTLSPVTLNSRFKRELGKVSSQRASELLPIFTSLSSDVGSIRKINLPRENWSGKTVIHIQDVHMNAEAQKNIGAAIEHLLGDQRINLVALEGAFSPIDLSRFRRFPHQDTIQKVANYLLRENKITGPIHTAFITPHALPPIVGVDDREHYKANVEAYKQAAPQAKKLQEKLTRLLADLENRRKEIFNAPLRRYDMRVQAYRNGNLSLGDYLKFLAKEIPTPSTNVDTFLAALELETTLNFKQVEQERTHLLRLLSERLDQKTLSELVERSMAYRLGTWSYADFFGYLKELCSTRGIPLTRYPAMNSYIQYVSLADGIDQEKLFQEVKGMEKQGYEDLIKSETERELVREMDYLHLAGKLIEFSLSAEEWGNYKSMVDRRSSIGQGVINNKSSTIHRLSTIDYRLNLSPFERFYFEAEHRDLAMSSNLLKEMNRTGARVAVLVTGGFHSTGIAERLKSERMASINFVPKITKVDTGSGSQYLSVFTQEKTPLEKMFQGEKLFLSISPMAKEIHALGAALTAGEEKRRLRIIGDDGTPTFNRVAEEVAKSVTVELEGTTSLVTVDNGTERNSIAVQEIGGELEATPVRRTENQLRNILTNVPRTWRSINVHQFVTHHWNWLLATAATIDLMVLAKWFGLKAAFATTGILFALVGILIIIKIIVQWFSSPGPGSPGNTLAIETPLFVIKIPLPRSLIPERIAMSNENSQSHNDDKLKRLEDEFESIMSAWDKSISEPIDSRETENKIRSILNSLSNSQTIRILGSASGSKIYSLSTRQGSLVFSFSTDGSKINFLAVLSEAYQPADFTGAFKMVPSSIANDFFVEISKIVSSSRQTMEFSLMGKIFFSFVNPYVDENSHRRWFVDNPVYRSLLRTINPVHLNKFKNHIYFFGPHISFDELRNVLGSSGISRIFSSNSLENPEKIQIAVHELAHIAVKNLNDDQLAKIGDQYQALRTYLKSGSYRDKPMRSLNEEIVGRVLQAISKRTRMIPIALVEENPLQALVNWVLIGDLPEVGDDVLVLLQEMKLISSADEIKKWLDRDQAVGAGFFLTKYFGITDVVKAAKWEDRSVLVAGFVYFIAWSYFTGFHTPFVTSSIKLLPWAFGQSSFFLIGILVLSFLYHATWKVMKPHGVGPDHRFSRILGATVIGSISALGVPFILAGVFALLTASVATGVGFLGTGFFILLVPHPWWDTRAKQSTLTDEVSLKPSPKPDSPGSRANENVFYPDETIADPVLFFRQLIPEIKSIGGLIATARKFVRQGKVEEGFEALTQAEQVIIKLSSKLAFVRQRVEEGALPDSQKLDFLFDRVVNTVGLADIKLCLEMIQLGLRDLAGKSIKEIKIPEQIEVLLEIFDEKQSYIKNPTQGLSYDVQQRINEKYAANIGTDALIHPWLFKAFVWWANRYKPSLANLTLEQAEREFRSMVERIWKQAEQKIFTPLDAGEIGARLDKKAIRHNVKQLYSYDMAKQWAAALVASASERAYAGVYVDATGRIIAFGFYRDLPQELKISADRGEIFGVTLSHLIGVLGDLLIEKPSPAAKFSLPTKVVDVLNASVILAKEGAEAFERARSEMPSIGYEIRDRSNEREAWARAVLHHWFVRWLVVPWPELPMLPGFGWISIPVAGTLGLSGVWGVTVGVLVAALFVSREHGRHGQTQTWKQFWIRAFGAALILGLVFSPVIPWCGNALHITTWLEENIWDNSTYIRYAQEALGAVFFHGLLNLVLKEKYRFVKQADPETVFPKEPQANFDAAFAKANKLKTESKPTGDIEKVPLEILVQVEKKLTTAISIILAPWEKLSTTQETQFKNIVTRLYKARARMLYYQARRKFSREQPNRSLDEIFEAEALLDQARVDLSRTSAEINPDILGTSSIVYEDLADLYTHLALRLSSNPALHKYSRGILGMARINYRTAIRYRKKECDRRDRSFSQDHVLGRLYRKAGKIEPEVRDLSDDQIFLLVATYKIYFGPYRRFPTLLAYIHRYYHGFGATPAPVPGLGRHLKELAIPSNAFGAMAVFHVSEYFREKGAKIIALSPRVKFGEESGENVYPPSTEFDLVVEWPRGNPLHEAGGIDLVEVKSLTLDIPPQQWLPNVEQFLKQIDALATVSSISSVRKILRVKTGPFVPLNPAAKIFRTVPIQEVWIPLFPSSLLVPSDPLFEMPLEIESLNGESPDLKQTIESYLKSKAVGFAMADDPDFEIPDLDKIPPAFPDVIVSGDQIDRFENLLRAKFKKDRFTTQAERVDFVARRMGWDLKKREQKIVAKVFAGFWVLADAASYKKEELFIEKILRNPSNRDGVRFRIAKSGSLGKLQSGYFAAPAVAIEPPKFGTTVERGQSRYALSRRNFLGIGLSKEKITAIPEPIRQIAEASPMKRREFIVLMNCISVGLNWVGIPVPSTIGAPQNPTFPPIEDDDVSAAMDPFLFPEAAILKEQAEYAVGTESPRFMTQREIENEIWKVHNFLKGRTLPPRATLDGWVSSSFGVLIQRVKFVRRAYKAALDGDSIGINAYLDLLIDEHKKVTAEFNEDVDEFEKQLLILQRLKDEPLEIRRATVGAAVQGLIKVTINPWLKNDAEAYRTASDVSFAAAKVRMENLLRQLQYLKNLERQRLKRKEGDNLTIADTAHLPTIVLSEDFVNANEQIPVKLLEPVKQAVAEGKFELPARFNTPSDIPEMLEVFAASNLTERPLVHEFSQPGKATSLEEYQDEEEAMMTNEADVNRYATQRLFSTHNWNPEGHVLDDLFQIAKDLNRDFHRAISAPKRYRAMHEIREFIQRTYTKFKHGVFAMADETASSLSDDEIVDQIMEINTEIADRIEKENLNYSWAKNKSVYERQLQIALKAGRTGAGQAEWQLHYEVWDGRLVGYALYCPTGDPNKFDLHLLATRPGFENRGIGSTLLRKVLESARQQNAQSVVLFIVRGNTDARNFYLNLSKSDRFKDIIAHTDPNLGYSRHFDKITFTLKPLSPPVQNPASKELVVTGTLPYLDEPDFLPNGTIKAVYLLDPRLDPSLNKKTHHAVTLVASPFSRGSHDWKKGSLHCDLHVVARPYPVNKLELQDKGYLTHMDLKADENGNLKSWHIIDMGTTRRGKFPWVEAAVEDWLNSQIGKPMTIQNDSFPVRQPGHPSFIKLTEFISQLTQGAKRTLPREELIDGLYKSGILAIPHLVEALSNNDAEIRAVAKEVLKMGNGLAAAYLIPGLASPNVHFRESAKELLIDAGENALPALTGLLTHDPKVRFNATSLIQKIDPATPTTLRLSPIFDIAELPLPEPSKLTKKTILVYGGLGAVIPRFYLEHFKELTEKYQIDLQAVDLAPKDKARQRIAELKLPYSGYFSVPPGTPLQGEVAEFLKEVLKSDPKGLLIVTRPDTHLDLMKWGLKNNMQVFVEKPIVKPEHLEEEEKLYHDHRDAIFAIDFFLDNPAALDAIKVLMNGKFGELRAVRGRMIENVAIENGREWLTNPKVSGGGLGMDMLVHLLALGELLMERFDRSFSEFDVHADQSALYRYNGAPKGRETYARVVGNLRGIPVDLGAGKGTHTNAYFMILEGTGGDLEINLGTENTPAFMELRSKTGEILFHQNYGVDIGYFRTVRKMFDSVQKLGNVKQEERDFRHQATTLGVKILETAHHKVGGHYQLHTLGQNPDLTKLEAAEINRVRFNPSIELENLLPTGRGIILFVTQQILEMGSYVFEILKRNGRDTKQFLVLIDSKFRTIVLRNAPLCLGPFFEPGVAMTICIYLMNLARKLFPESLYPLGFSINQWPIAFKVADELYEPGTAQIHYGEKAEWINLDDPKIDLYEILGDLEIQDPEVPTNGGIIRVRKQDGEYKVIEKPKGVTVEMDGYNIKVTDIQTGREISFLYSQTPFSIRGEERQNAPQVHVRPHLPKFGYIPSRSEPGIGPSSLLFLAFTSRGIYQKMQELFPKRTNRVIQALGLGSVFVERLGILYALENWSPIFFWGGLVILALAHVWLEWQSFFPNKTRGSPTWSAISFLFHLGIFSLYVVLPHFGFSNWYAFGIHFIADSVQTWFVIHYWEDYLRRLEPELRTMRPQVQKPKYSKAIAKEVYAQFRKFDRLNREIRNANPFATWWPENDDERDKIILDALRDKITRNPNPTYRLETVTEGEQLLGYVVFGVETGRAFPYFKGVYVPYLGIHPSFQNNGLGKKLMKKVFAFAQDQSVPFTFLHCNKKNKGGLNFYRKLPIQEGMEKFIGPKVGKVSPRETPNDIMFLFQNKPSSPTDKDVPSNIRDRKPVGFAMADDPDFEIPDLDKIPLALPDVLVSGDQIDRFENLLRAKFKKARFKTQAERVAFVAQRMGWDLEKREQKIVAKVFAGFWVLADTASYKKEELFIEKILRNPSNRDGVRFRFAGSGSMGKLQSGYFAAPAVAIEPPKTGKTVERGQSRPALSRRNFLGIGLSKDRITDIPEPIRQIAAASPMARREFIVLMNCIAVGLSWLGIPVPTTVATPQKPTFPPIKSFNLRLALNAFIFPDAETLKKRTGFVLQSESPRFMTEHEINNEIMVLTKFLKGITSPSRFMLDGWFAPSFGVLIQQVNAVRRAQKAVLEGHSAGINAYLDFLIHEHEQDADAEHVEVRGELEDHIKILRQLKKAPLEKRRAIVGASVQEMIDGRINPWLKNQATAYQGSSDMSFRAAKARMEALLQQLQYLNDLERQRLKRKEGDHSTTADTANLPTIVLSEDFLNANEQIPLKLLEPVKQAVAEGKFELPARFRSPADIPEMLEVFAASNLTERPLHEYSQRGHAESLEDLHIEEEGVMNIDKDINQEGTQLLFSTDEHQPKGRVLKDLYGLLKKVAPEIHERVTAANRFGSFDSIPAFIRSTYTKFKRGFFPMSDQTKKVELAFESGNKKIVYADGVRYEYFKDRLIAKYSLDDETRPWREEFAQLSAELHRVQKEILYDVLYKEYDPDGAIKNKFKWAHKDGTEVNEQLIISLVKELISNEYGSIQNTNLELKEAQVKALLDVQKKLVIAINTSPSLIRRVARERDSLHIEVTDALTATDSQNVNIYVKNQTAYGVMGRARLIADGLVHAGPKIQVNIYVFGESPHLLKSTNPRIHIARMTEAELVTQKLQQKAKVHIFTTGQRIKDVSSDDVVFTVNALPSEQLDWWNNLEYILGRRNNNLKDPFGTLYFDRDLFRRREEADRWPEEQLFKARAAWNLKQGQVESNLLTELGRDENWDPLKSIWTWGYVQDTTKFMRELLILRCVLQSNKKEPIPFRPDGEQIVIHLIRPGKYRTDALDLNQLINMGIAVIDSNNEQMVFRPAVRLRVPITVVVHNRILNEHLKTLQSELSGTVKNRLGFPVFVTGSASWLEAISAGAITLHDDYDTMQNSKTDLLVSTLIRSMALANPGLLWRELEAQANLSVSNLRLGDPYHAEKYKDLKKWTTESRNYSRAQFHFDLVDDILEAVIYGNAPDRIMKRGEGEKAPSPSSLSYHLTGDPELGLKGFFPEAAVVALISLLWLSQPIIAAVLLFLLARLDATFHFISQLPNAERGSPSENLKFRWSVFRSEFNLRQFLFDPRLNPQFARTFFIYLLYPFFFQWSSVIPGPNIIFLVPVLIHFLNDLIRLWTNHREVSLATSFGQIEQRLDKRNTAPNQNLKPGISASRSEAFAALARNVGDKPIDIEINQMLADPFVQDLMDKRGSSAKPIDKARALELAEVSAAVVLSKSTSARINTQASDNPILIFDGADTEEGRQLLRVEIMAALLAVGLDADNMVVTDDKGQRDAKLAIEYLRSVGFDMTRVTWNSKVTLNDVLTKEGKEEPHLDTEQADIAGASLVIAPEKWLQSGLPIKFISLKKLVPLERIQSLTNLLRSLQAALLAA